MNKTYHLHWFRADPFGRIVVLVVGNYKDALEECDKIFRPKDKSTPLFSACFGEVLDCHPCRSKPENCGRTVCNDVGDVVMWFPVFPTPGTLAHELFHAVTDILESAGVTDTSGETNAYLLGEMYDHFFSALEKDRKGKRKRT